MSVPKLSMIVPAHNEEKSIQKTVSGILGKIRGSEVIVVCDGCTDRTFDEAKKVRGKAVVIAFNGRMGKGAAIAEGTGTATGRQCVSDRRLRASRALCGVD